MPEPEPGLVIPYAYLWRHEHRAGVEEGRKTRPAVIVLAVGTPDGTATRVTVVPVTHAPPAKGREAIEMPPRVKAALRLDGERSWIILDEVNQFTWPGHDIRLVPGARDRFAYGFIPPRLHDRIVARILELAAARKVAAIPRD